MLDAIFKICIFGDAGCGKTALTTRYMTSKFVSDTKMTIGVDLQTKELKVDKKKIKLQIWDFGGEERFRFFLPEYVKGAHGGILMYDITNSASINHIDEWLSVLKEAYQSFPIVLVGGKLDLEDVRDVPLEKAKEIAESRDLNECIECSSKTGENVEMVFEELTRSMLAYHKTSWA